jgi:hypothetical protein
MGRAAIFANACTWSAAQLRKSPAVSFGVGGALLTVPASAEITTSQHAIVVREKLDAGLRDESYRPHGYYFACLFPNLVYS